MTEVSIGEKTYSLGYTMLSVVRAKALTGKSFFAIAAQEAVGDDEKQIDPETAIQKVLDLLLIGLQTKHADEFKTIDDVAQAFPDLNAMRAVSAAINVELAKFLSTDESLRKQASDAQSAAKKKIPGKPSPKTSTVPSAS